MPGPSVDRSAGHGRIAPEHRQDAIGEDGGVGVPIPHVSRSRRCRLSRCHSSRASRSARDALGGSREPDYTSGVPAESYRLLGTLNADEGNRSDAGSSRRTRRARRCRRPGSGHGEDAHDRLHRAPARDQARRRTGGLRSTRPARVRQRTGGRRLAVVLSKQRASEGWVGRRSPAYRDPHHSRNGEE